MSFSHYIPPAPLSEFVALFWLYENIPPAPHMRERLLPTGTMELVFNLHKDEIRLYDKHHHNQFTRVRGSVVSGMQSEFFVIDTAGQQSVIGVHFKPGGTFPFFGMPSSELQDMHVGLEDLWPDADSVRARLLEASTPAAKFRVLELALLSHARSLELNPAITFALQQFHAVPHVRTVAGVTSDIGLSPRRFIRLFHDQVGLTPKVFCRVRRFQAVVQLIHRAQTIDWADVALSCGYFDQAHFIRDFQAFSGINPSAYLSDRTEHMNHVPIF